LAAKAKRSWLRPPIVTRAPRACSALAVASPIPLLPPSTATWRWRIVVVLMELMVGTSISELSVR
jgi:hypothetical protein